MKNKLSALLSVSTAIVAIVAMVLVLSASVQTPDAQADAGTITARTVIPVTAKVIITDATSYSAVWNPSVYYMTDLFVYSDFSGTLTATLTMQVSPDNVYWADLGSISAWSYPTGTDTVSYTTYTNVGWYQRLKIVTTQFDTGDRLTVTVKPLVKNTAGR